MLLTWTCLIGATTCGPIHCGFGWLVESIESVMLIFGLGEASIWAGVNIARGIDSCTSCGEKLKGAESGAAPGYEAVGHAEVAGEGAMGPVAGDSASTLFLARRGARGFRCCGIEYSRDDAYSAGHDTNGGSVDHRSTLCVVTECG